MTVTRKSFNAVMNASGTSVDTITVGVPTDTMEGDLMLAVTSAPTGTPTGTGPDGFELLGSFTSSTLQQSNLYRRIATDSEPADYTWDFTQTSTLGVALIVFVGAHDVLSWDAMVQTAESTPNSRRMHAARDAVAYSFCCWRDGAASTFTVNQGVEEFDITSDNTASTIHRGITASYYGPGVSSLTDIVNIGDALPNTTWTSSGGALDHAINWAILIDNKAPDAEDWSSTNGDFAVELKLDNIAVDSVGSITTEFRGDVTGQVSAFFENGENAPNEVTENLADGLESTKWLDFADASFVTYDFGASNAKTIRRYRLTSANDAPERDPYNWTLEGSQNNTDFTVLDTRTAEAFGNRGETREFKVADPGSYRYYKLNIATNRRPSIATSTQLAEFRLSTIDVWEDITTKVVEESKIRITRGLQGSSGRSDFTRAYVELNNTDGRFSLRNQDSLYYGALQRNTEMRISKAFGTKSLQLQGDVQLEGTNYSGDGVRAALTSDTQITGDIDVRIDLELDSWRDEQMLCGISTPTDDPIDPHASWSLHIDNNGQLNWLHTPGSGTVSYLSTVAVPQATRQALRVTVDVNNGSGGSTATFYTSDTIAGSWTQLGDPVTITTGTTSIGYEGGALCVGHVSGKDERGIHGLVYHFELRSGIDGTLVSDVDFTSHPVDTFSRVVADGWGTSDSGRAWTSSGGAASDYAVTSGTGRMVHNTNGVRRVMTLAGNVADSDVYTSWSMPVVPSGDSAYVMSAARYAGVNDQYFARAQVASGGAVTLTLRKRVAGAETQLTTVSPGITVAAGKRYRLRFEVTGTTLRAKCWDESAGEPAAWQTTTTDSSLTAANPVALWSITNAGISTPFTVLFDDVVSPALADPAAGNGAHEFEENGNRWVTVNNAVISNRRYRFHGEVAEWPIYWDTTGTWIAASATGAGIQRRLERSNNPLSTMRRYHTKGVIEDPGAFERFATPFAYWPMEDHEDAYQIASGLPSKPGMQIYGNPLFGESDGGEFKESGALIKLNEATFAGQIANAMVGYSDIRWMMYAPTAPVVGTDFITLYGTGLVHHWKVEYTGTNTWRIRGFDEDDTGTPFWDTGDIAVATVGEKMHCRLILDQSGSSVSITLSVVDEFGNSLGSDTDTFLAASVGRPYRIEVNRDNPRSTDLYVGHLALYGTDSPPFAGNELNAHHYETAGNRIKRLCAEEQIEFRYSGSLDDTALMGYQAAESVFAAMSTAVHSDDGYLVDPLDAFGIELRTNRSVLNRAAHMTLSYTSGELSGELRPTEDDSYIVNDFTASRGGAGSARYQRTDGPLSVNQPPDGVAPYERNQSYSLAHEGQCVDIASWQVHKGTVDEERYPRIELALENLRIAADAALTERILLLDVGHRVDITDTPSFLPPDDIRQTVVGYEEWFDNFQHNFKLNTVPERWYEVAEYDSGYRFAQHESTLYRDVSAAASTIEVVNETGQPWSDTASDFDVIVDQERMTVTSVANVTSSYSTDSFNRADSTTTPGSTDGGTVSAWTEDLGNWGINSNAAYITPSGNSIMTIPGSADFEEVSVTVSTLAAPGEAWINFRFSDTSNRWRWGGDIATDARLEKVVAGAVTTYTPDAAEDTFQIAQGDVLKARCHGSVIEVFHNGRLALCISDTFNEAATRVGIQTDADSTRFDNFVWISSNPRQNLTVTRGAGPSTGNPHKSGAEIKLYQTPYRGM